MVRKMSREEVEYGIKEFIQGLLIGLLIGFLIASQLL
jgi:F0F1-type ATP synthase assembly protein I|tara:strand:- start:429 stop:539 length:111 start_codon:yes stop_codon:yes gene_type:complete